MGVKDRITFINAFKYEFAAYIDHMEEEYKENIGEYWYHLTLKEGVVSSDFTKKVYPFVNENEKPFDESFDIWVREADEPPEIAVSVTINPNYTGYGRSYSDLQNEKERD
jgi:hypothetical protein